MGTDWKLRLVDHDHVVVRGVPILERVVRSGNLEPLREHLLSKPWETNSELLISLQARKETLEKLGAPQVILDHARRTFAEAKGEHCTRDVLGRLSLEELRGLLLSWNTSQRTYEQGSMVDLLHWMLDPERRSRAKEAFIESNGNSLIEPHWRVHPNHQPTIWDYAFYGSAEYPTDFKGQPIGGGDLFGSYNPPEMVRKIWAKMSTVQLEDGGKIAAEYRKHREYIAGTLVESEIEEDVRRGWDHTRSAYLVASEKGFGVSVEVSS